MNIINGIKNVARRLREDFKSPTIYPYRDKTSRLLDNVSVVSAENLVMEQSTSIGPDSRIMNLRAKFVMKKYSFSGPGLLVVTGDHMPILGTPLIQVTDQMKDELDIEHKYDQDVVVDEDVWLGARVTLLNGAHIGRGSIVAAGSIVTRSLPPYCVGGGIPAKHIKNRWTVEQILEHESKIYPPEERFTREYLESIIAE